MSDPAAEFRDAISEALKTDSGVAAAFGPKTVKVFKLKPPVNQPKPYIYIAGFQVAPAIAECLDAAETEVQIDVWSLTDPPGYAEVELIARAALAALAPLDASGTPSPPFNLPSHTVKTVTPLGVDYLDDPSDGKTVHGVIRLSYATDPL